MPNFQELHRKEAQINYSAREILEMALFAYECEKDRSELATFLMEQIQEALEKLSEE